MSVTSDTRRKSSEECSALFVCPLCYAKHSEEYLRKHEFAPGIQACSHAAIQYLSLFTCCHRGFRPSMNAYIHGVILRIVKAGCHLVAIAQVVELKSEAPGSIPGGCQFFTVL